LSDQQKLSLPSFEPILVIFTAIIGMFLATPGLPPPGALLFGPIGITLFAGSAAALLTSAAPAWAGDNGTLTSPRVPADPTPDQVEQTVPDLANALNKPITGASEDPLVVGTEPPRLCPSSSATTAATMAAAVGRMSDLMREVTLRLGALGGSCRPRTSGISQDAIAPITRSGAPLSERREQHTGFEEQI